MEIKTTREIEHYDSDHIAYENRILRKILRDKDETIAIKDEMIKRLEKQLADREDDKADDWICAPWGKP